MRRSYYDRHKGICPVATKQGNPEQPKDIAAIEARNKERDICLNCTKKVCRGCEKIFKGKKKKGGEV